MFGASHYGVLPSYVERHTTWRSGGRLVYLGACSSAWNGTMAAALLSSGANAVLGYSGPVSEQFAFEVGAEFFERLLRPMTIGGQTLTAGEAFEPRQDPAHPGFGQRSDPGRPGEL